jgi:hypothetical protein
MWRRDSPPRHDYWTPNDEDQHLFYNALSTLEGETDYSRDEFFGSTSSPALSIRDLLVDSDEDHVSLNYAPLLSAIDCCHQTVPSSIRFFVAGLRMGILRELDTTKVVA